MRGVRTMPRVHEQKAFDDDVRVFTLDEVMYILMNPVNDRRAAKVASVSMQRPTCLFMVGRVHVFLCR